MRGTGVHRLGAFRLSATRVNADLHSDVDAALHLVGAGPSPGPRVGAGVDQLREGQRVGVPWLGYSCGRCGFCRAGRENLYPEARFQVSEPRSTSVPTRDRRSLGASGPTP